MWISYHTFYKFRIRELSMNFEENCKDAAKYAQVKPTTKISRISGNNELACTSDFNLHFSAELLPNYFGLMTGSGQTTKPPFLQVRWQSMLAKYLLQDDN